MEVVPAWTHRPRGLYGTWDGGKCARGTASAWILHEGAPGCWQMAGLEARKLRNTDTVTHAELTGARGLLLSTATALEALEDEGCKRRRRSSAISSERGSREAAGEHP